MLRFLRPLFFTCDSDNINLLLKHIPSVDNTLADYLSRYQIDRFRLAHPSADPDASIIPDIALTF